MTSDLLQIGLCQCWRKNWINEVPKFHLMQENLGYWTWWFTHWYWSVNKRVVSYNFDHRGYKCWSALIWGYERWSAYVLLGVSEFGCMKSWGRPCLIHTFEHHQHMISMIEYKKSAGVVFFIHSFRVKSTCEYQRKNELIIHMIVSKVFWIRGCEDSLMLIRLLFAFILI